VKGFRTGDLVKAAVPSGKKAGTYIGRVAVRASGSFNIQTRTETIQGISHRYCRRLLSGDGYNYAQTTAKAIHPTAEQWVSSPDFYESPKAPASNVEQSAHRPFERSA